MLLYYFRVEIRLVRFFEHFQVIEKPLYILKILIFLITVNAEAFALYDSAIRLLINVFTSFFDILAFDARCGVNPENSLNDENRETKANNNTETNNN